MKKIFAMIVIAAVFLPVYSYAVPVPSDPCPCNELNVGGLTGAEMLAEICPGGELAPDGILEFDQENITVSLDDPVRVYGVGFFGKLEGPACRLGVGGGGILSGISLQELEVCRVTILEACGLNKRAIPTLSEWGLIAMAGVLGLAGLIVIRKRATA